MVVSTYGLSLVGNTYHSAFLKVVAHMSTCTTVIPIARVMSGLVEVS